MMYSLNKFVPWFIEWVPCVQGTPLSASTSHWFLCSNQLTCASMIFYSIELMSENGSLKLTPRSGLVTIILLIGIIGRLIYTFYGGLSALKCWLDLWLCSYHITNSKMEKKSRSWLEMARDWYHAFLGIAAISRIINNGTPSLAMCIWRISSTMKS